MVRRAVEMAAQMEQAGVQRDITDPVEADAPGPDHGHDQAVNQ